MKDLVLAIDVGTQSTRALVFDASGAQVDQARALYDPPYHSPEPGWAELDPEVYWERVGTACRTLWSQGRADPGRVASACATFQRGTVVCLDAEGAPLRAAILWLDQRRSARPPRLSAAWHAALAAAGASNVVARFQAEAEANWLAEHQPHLHGRIAHYLLLSGFVTGRLTGRWRDSIACQVGYLPFDFKRLAYAAPSDWKWKALAIAPATLPELVAPGRPIGALTADAARHLGLPQGLPVISGGSDKACEVLGSGCLEPHQACIGFGTTATFNVDSPRYVEPVRFVPAYASARAGRFNVEYQVFRGFWMVTWFKEQFAHLERERARELGVEPEALLEQAATGVPAGSLGLTLQPFWTPGVAHPGPEGRGAIVGFGAHHRKPHLYRAMLEGLVYEMRSGRERIQARTRTPVTELTLCGGGSRSDLVLQIAADVFGLPARRARCDEASGLGAAILGAVGAGLHPTVEAAAAAMTGPGRVFEPIPANVARYDQLYREVYSPLYGRLQPLYRAMRRITGYPPLP